MSYLDNSGVSYLWSKIKAAFAPKSHKHAASDITSGTLGTSRGGTGITSNPSMLTNLGSTSSANVFQSSPRPGVTGTLAVANGGTGGSTAALARTNLGVPSATDLANIESSIAYVESTTAKTNHAVGDYFMLGDVLMRTTAAIATGEQITTSNATPATVQSQIDTLRDSLGQYRGVLADMSYSALLNVKPGTYVATNATANRPVTNNFAHVFVHPLPASMNRVFAIAVFDNNTVWTISKYGSLAEWVQL